MTDDAAGNGGMLKEKVRRLEEDVKELKDTVDDVHDGLYGVKGDYITRAEFTKLVDRMTQTEKDVASLKERLTIYNLAQATFTSVIGAIAVIVGTLFK
jgi:uncharacterized protein (UPF0335 family)